MAKSSRAREQVVIEAVFDFEGSKRLGGDVPTSPIQAMALQLGNDPNFGGARQPIPIPDAVSDYVAGTGVDDTPPNGAEFEQRVPTAVPRVAGGAALPGVQPSFRGGATERAVARGFGAGAAGRAAGVPLAGAGVAGLAGQAVVAAGQTLLEAGAIEADPFLTDFEKQTKITAGLIRKTPLFGEEAAQLFEATQKQELATQRGAVGFLTGIGNQLAEVGIKFSDLDPEKQRVLARLGLQISRTAVENRVQAAKLVSEAAGSNFANQEGVVAMAGKVGDSETT